MGRTQIYLTDRELELLDEARRRTGASRSELIRRAITTTYGRERRSSEERLSNLMAARGLWKDRDFTGEEYVRAVRGGDMNANLRRLGVEN